MNYAWLLQAAGFVVLIGAAVAVIVKGFRWVFKTLRMVNEFLEDWRGEEARPGYHKRPGVMERLVNLEEQVQAVVHEVQPNSGTSLKDQVARIEEHVVPSKETAR